MEKRLRNINLLQTVLFSYINAVQAEIEVLQSLQWRGGQVKNKQRDMMRSSDERSSAAGSSESVSPLQ